MEQRQDQPLSTGGNPPPGQYVPAPPYPPEPPFPLTFNVDYPDRPLNRLTSFFRFLWIIPIGIIAGLIGSGTLSDGRQRGPTRRRPRSAAFSSCRLS